MDPRTFDGMVRRFAGSLSRRSLVEGSFGAALLTAVGLSDDAVLAKKKRFKAEACIPSGKKCPAKKPRGKKGKKLGCDKCCQGVVVTVTNGKGNQIQKCSCLPLGSACTPDKSQQCCSGVCVGGACQAGPCTAVLGAACTSNAECCTGFCGDDVCQAEACNDLGTFCNVGADCCSGTCGDNTCQSGACIELGNNCQNSDQCCSDTCSGGACCLGMNAVCNILDDQCCAGLTCTDGGQQADSCQ